MTPAARLQAAIEVLSLAEFEARPVDGLLVDYGRKRRYMGAGDRSEVARQVWRVLRHRARLDWHLAQAGAPAGPRSRIVAALSTLDGRSPEHVAAIFDGSGYGPSRLDGAERGWLGRLGRASAEPIPEAVSLECPEWAEAGLREVFAGRFVPELRALLDEASTDIRVNTDKGTVEQCRKTLEDAGVSLHPTPYSPLGLRCAGRPPLTRHPLYLSGGFEIQEEASQIIGLLVEAAPGLQIVDFCAGAGGKTLVMAARMAGRGRIVAADISAGRLRRARERIKRAGYHHIEPKLLAGERDRWIAKQKGKFDRVLVDAPCSGVGTWRRHPDAKWRLPDLDDLGGRQGRILTSAARLVRPGGRLIYATCSLLPQENEDQLAAFLTSRPDFTALPVATVWRRVLPGPPPETGPYLRLTPAQHGTDGFFAAILERRADAATDSAPSQSETAE